MELAAEARNQVNECEKEIAAIKAGLKSLGPASAEDSEEKNALSVVLLKTAGLPAQADLQLKLQLSSPIEEAVLTTAEGSKSVFRSVEVGQAMLTVSASDAAIPLGNSEPLDLAGLIKLDAMSPEKEYSFGADIGILPDGSTRDTEAVITVTLKLTFVPSKKDQREELYELLNKATTRKAQAVEKLRQAALAASRQAVVARADGPGAAVKPGFLNKAKKEEKGLLSLYNKYLGPKSFARQAFPVAKNYIVFFAAVAIFHYKGDALALPPPV